MATQVFDAITDPIANPSSITFVTVSGQRTPGIATIDGSSGSPRKWDERGGYGLSGSTLVFTGKGLATFDILIELYDSFDWQDWATFRKIITVGRNKRDVPHDVQHPFLRDYDIAKCVIKDASFPKMTDEGVGQIIIPCQAFRGVKFALSKPDGAQATPLDPVDQTIAAKNAELTALNERLAK